MRWARTLPLTFLLPVALGIGPLIGGNSAWVEANYSRGLYPYISSALRIGHAAVGFSLVEVLLLVLAAAAFVRAFLSLAGIVRGTRSVANVALHGFSIATAMLGVAAAAWFVLWGFNYQRQTFAELAELDVAPSGVEELALLCGDLLGEAGALRVDLVENGDGVFELEGGMPSVLRRASAGYAACAGVYEVLDWNYGRPKPAWFSPILSRVGISGIYSPFTGEPHVNTGLADSELPFTVSHELAHQIGFAREDEANFLAILACRAHPDTDYRYSGALQGAAYAMGALARVDIARATQLWESAHPGILRDLAHSEQKWKVSKSPALTKISWEVNHAYLKSQGVAKGTASYGAVVDLLLAERRKRPEALAVEVPRIEAPESDAPGASDSVPPTAE